MEGSFLGYIRSPFPDIMIRRPLFHAWLLWVASQPLGCPLDSPPPPRPVHFAAPAPAARPVIAVRFSPGGHCATAIVAEIAAAKRSVRVAAYSLTSEPIATALHAAHARGVDVRVVCDPRCKTERGGKAGELAAAGIPVGYDHHHAIMHEKVIIIDDVVVIFGSYNWSNNAEHKNAEDMVIIRDGGVAGAFGADWWVHAGHAGLGE